MDEFSNSTLNIPMVNHITSLKTLKYCCISVSHHCLNNVLSIENNAVIHFQLLVRRLEFGFLPPPPPPPPRLKKRTVSEAKNIKQTFPYGELVKVLCMMSLSLTFSQ